MARYVFWVQTKGRESRRQIEQEIPDGDLRRMSRFQREQELAERFSGLFENLCDHGWYQIDGPEFAPAHLLMTDATGGSQ